MFHNTQDGPQQRIIWFMLSLVPKERGPAPETPMWSQRAFSGIGGQVEIQGQRGWATEKGRESRAKDAPPNAQLEERTGATAPPALLPRKHGKGPLSHDPDGCYQWGFFPWVWRYNLLTNNSVPWLITRPTDRLPPLYKAFVCYY